MTNQCELAARRAADLRTSAKYELNHDGTHKKLTLVFPAPGTEFRRDAFHRVTAQPEDRDAVERVPTRAGHESPTEALGRQLQDGIANVFGRSLHIREVDAGSCNGCEIEIAGLNSPVYDIERFGIHFVASPRHADMLLVTGPVTRNMELALRKTYDAMPEPRLVVAVGACGCSGGMFGRNYATLGGVDKVIPVDVYIPGCPPNPLALIHGILTAVGRLEVRGEK
jgi:NADH-quinone oxidoreductase B subunit